MKFSKKLLLVLLSLTVVFAFASCKKSYKDSVFSVLPENASVIVFDHSNGDQIKLLEKLKSQFPDLKLAEKISGTMPFLQGNEKYDTKSFFEQLVKPVLDGEFVFVAGGFLDFPSEGQRPEVMPVPEIYVAGQFEEADKVQEILDILMEAYEDKFTNLKKESKDGVDFWTDEAFYMARQGDLFFVTNNEKGREEALIRIKNKEGLIKNAKLMDDIEALAKDNLGYFYLDEKLMQNGFSNLYSLMGVDYAAEMIKTFGDTLAVWYADKDGLGVISTSAINKDDPNFAKFFPDSDYEITLADKVNGEGLIMYTEGPEFEIYFSSFVAGFMQGFNSTYHSDDFGAYDDREVQLMGPADHQSEDPRSILSPEDNPQSIEIQTQSSGGPIDFNLLMTNIFGSQTQEVEEVSEDSKGGVLRVLRSESKEAFSEGDLGENYQGDFYFDASRVSGKDYYKEFVSELAGLSGLNESDVRAIFDSPFAVSMAYSGGFLPTFGSYLSLEKAEVENAKKLILALDSYADQVIAAFDGLVGPGFGAAGALKKEVVTVSGGALHKLYLDLSVVPQDLMSGYNVIPGLNLKEIKVELYYGVTGDDVFVVAFYPDFEKNYGKNVVSSQAGYIEAKAQMDEYFGYSVVYFDLKSLFDLADTYLKISGGFIPPAELESYDLVKRFATTFKYFASSGVVEENQVKSKTFIRIEGVPVKAKE